MSSPETPADLARIVELDRAVRAADAAIEEAKGVIVELRHRSTALQSRLDDLNAVRPADTADLADGMVDALAADPSASPDPKAMAQAIELQAATRTKFDEWQVSVNLTEQAIAKVGREVVAAKAALQRTIETRNSPWNAFGVAAQAYLIEGFRAGIRQLHSDFVEPLLAFTDSVSASGLAKLDRDSFISLRQHVNGSLNVEKLMRFDRAALSQRACEPYIERFRATLSKKA